MIKSLRKIGLTFHIYSKGLWFVFISALAFVAMYFYVRYVSSIWGYEQYIVIYFMLYAGVVAWTLGGWLKISGSNKSIINIYQHMHVGAIFAVMVMIFVFYALTIWAVAAIGIHMLCDGTRFYMLILSKPLFNLIYPIGATSALAFVSINFFSAFVLGVIALAKNMTHRKVLYALGIAALTLVPTIIILSIANLLIATIIAFCVQVALIVASMVVMFGFSEVDYANI